MDPTAIFRAHDFAPQPDLVLLLTLSAVESVARIRDIRQEALNDFEQQEQLQKVAALFASFSHDCIVRIQASQPVSEVQSSIKEAVWKMLARKGGICAI